MILLFITLAFPFMLSAGDTHDTQPHHVTVTTRNESATIPLHVARLSFFMRNYIQQPIFAKTNVISLDFQGKPLQDAFDLELLIPFVTQAEETLKAKLTSSIGSYVQLTGEKPLISINDPEKILKLFIACDQLQFDFNQSHDFDHEAIIKAIALKMVHLEKSRNEKELFATFDDIAAKHSYNFQDFAWPYIKTQYHLIHFQRLAEKIPYLMVFRDVLAHDKLKNWSRTYDQNNTILYLDSMNLSSLQGIENIDLPTVNELYLQHNKLTHIPDLNCPELIALLLWDNQLTIVPQCSLPKLQRLYLTNNNITTLPADLNNFPQLMLLDLRGNPVTKIPETLKRPGLTIQVGEW